MNVNSYEQTQAQQNWFALGSAREENNADVIDKCFKTILEQSQYVAQLAKLGAWLPIETAPKDKRILLGFNGLSSVCGCWDDDRHAKNPKPFWTHDLYYLEGKRKTRTQQPVAWMSLPEVKDSLLPPTVEVIVNRDNQELYEKTF